MTVIVIITDHFNAIILGSGLMKETSGNMTRHF